MYVLPRGLESLWSVLRRRSYVPFVPGGEVLLTRCVPPLLPSLSPRRFSSSHLGTSADSPTQCGPLDGDVDVPPRAQDALRPRPVRSLPIRRAGIETPFVEPSSYTHVTGMEFHVVSPPSPASNATKNLSLTPSPNPRPMSTSFGVTSSEAERGTWRMSYVSRTPWRT